MPIENGLPLLEPPKEVPTFPQVNINVTPQGMVISVEVAPGVTSPTIRLGEDMMNNITRMWIQTRKQLEDQLRFVEHIKATKNNN